MKKILFLVTVALCLAIPFSALACELSKGQVVYVSSAFNYGTDLSVGTTRVLVRNPNPEEGQSITLNSVILNNPYGNFVLDFLNGTPLEVEPLTTKTFDVFFDNLCPFPLEPEHEENIVCPWPHSSGRPSVVVTWSSEEKLCEPIIQSALFLSYPPHDQTPSLTVVPGTVISEAKEK